MLESMRSKFKGQRSKNIIARRSEGKGQKSNVRDQRSKGQES